ncbi:immunoglobulin domain-containing protein [Fibrisoma montanum]|nr:immunoglobulin domain-containing protein [Fibrisoma montanum]
MNPPSLRHTLTHYGTRSRYRCTTLDSHAAWPGPSQLVRRFLALRNDLLLTGLFCLLWGVGQGQTIRYVKPSASGTGTGSSWANASGDLQAMINASQAGDQVWVAAGLYKPTTTTDRNVSFSIPSGVALYGGFLGTESSVGQRPLINPVNGQPSSTTLSGNIGDAATNADNTFSVVRLRNASAQTRLDGLVITGGNANGSFPNERGGGIRNDGSGSGGSSSPVLNNISFVGNLATRNGEGAAGSGGALYNDGSNGGSSNPVLTNVSFVDNSANGIGGAIFNNSRAGSSRLVLTNVSFVGNSATAGNGGAIYNDGRQGSSRPVLTNVSFVGNSASSNGGAIFSDGGSGSSFQLTNVSFQVNTATRGGALYLDATSLSLTNGIIFNNGLDYAITNLGGSSTITARYCLFESGVSGYTDGGNNRTTTTNPFVSTTSTQLAAGSLAIDAGNSSDPGLTGITTDLAGNNRIVGCQVDLGPYEFQTTTSQPLAITQPPASSSAVATGANVRVPVGLNVTATSLQWVNQAGLVSGQTSATLTLNGVTTSQSGSYSLVATGPCNSVTTTAFSLSVSPPCNPVVYVTQAGAGLQNGTSWTNALSGTALQGALATACGSTTFLVGAGLYTPTTGTDRNVSFTIPSGVQLYGGFVGTESSVGQRPLINPVNGQPSSTTLSGNIGDAATNADNTFSVVRLRNASAQTRLDGLVISGGNANGSFPNDEGGGILNDGSGGGSSSNPMLVNLSLVANRAENGGGLYNDGGNQGNSSPVLTNVSFEGNSALSGGGLLNRGAVQGNSSPVLTNVSFVGNSASALGGAIFNEGTQGSSSPVLTNVSFVANSAAGNGGAIFNNGTSGSSSPVLTNVSFQANTAQQGRAVFLVEASLSLTNSIIVNNGLDNAINSNDSGLITARFCLFEAGLTGYTSDPSNLTTTTNPFVSTTTTQLNACSEAIDAGDNAVEAGSTDLAANPRRVRTIDIGAYEFQDDPATLAITQQPTSANAVCEGQSVSVSVVVSGASPTYQWYKDGTTLANQTAATLSLPSVTTANAGRYSVVVTGTCNSLTSTAFSLTVNPSASVSISPSTTAICAGQTATFTASGADTYRWSTGETTAAISVSASGTYALTATTSAGCAATAAAGLTVNARPQASLTSNSPLSCTQTSVSLSAGPAAQDGQPFTYVFSGPGLSQSGTANTASVSQPGTYALTVTSAAGCSASATTTVTGATALTLTQPPTSQTACVGTSVTFAVQAQGPQGLTYAWFKNSADPSQPVLATTPTYEVNVNEGGKAGRYLVRVSAPGCASQQTEARLSVNQRPVAPPPTSTRRQLCPSPTPVELSQYVSRTNASYQLRYSTEPGQALNGSQVVLNQPGSYAYQVTQLDPATGCESVPTRFTLTVNATTQLVSLPPAQSVCSGSDLTLTVQASVTSLRYEWFRGSISNLNKLADNPSQQTGTTTASLKLIRVSQSESYFVRISGECGVISSEAIPVTVQACGARQGVGEATRGLQVVVLGNPVAGQTVEVEVRGAQAQPLRLQLIDQRGQLVDELARPAAQAVESVRLRLGQVAGLYLLRVATPTQRQTVKVVKH